MYSSQNKRSIFKLSGNMALGGNITTPRVPDPPSTYTTQQLLATKNSLRLLKSKQSQKESYPNPDYQRQSNTNNYNNKYNVYDGYQKQGGSLYEEKNTRKSNLDNQFMDLTYKARGNSRNVYQNTQSRQTDYQTYSQKQVRPAPEVKKKQNVNQKKYQKYQEEEYKEKPSLPPRNRVGQSKITNTNTTMNTNINTNAIQEKPLNQLKGNNNQLPDEYQSDDVQLVECKAGCGRSFKPSVLRTHQKICKKVFQSKRKEFNAQDQRVVEMDQKKLAKKGATVAKKIQQQKSKGNQKMAKWKAQSLAFRQIIKGGNNKPKNAQQQEQYQQMQSAIKQASGYIKCPTCGRSFNETAGKRHMTHCAQQAKKNKFKK